MGLLVARTVVAGVEVAVAAPFSVRTNCGGFTPDSRLAMLMAVELKLVTPRLKRPSPVTKALTSVLTQTPLVKAPEDPNWLPRSGALS